MPNPQAVFVEPSFSAYQLTESTQISTRIAADGWRVFESGNMDLGYNLNPKINPKMNLNPKINAKSNPNPDPTLPYPTPPPTPTSTPTPTPKPLTLTLTLT